MLREMSTTRSVETQISARLLIIVALLFLLPVTICDAQENTQTRIPTVTRLVLQFADLEKNLLSALTEHNSATIQSLVADDFEMRTGSIPGEPVARADWLRNAASTSGKSSRIEQMAVHDHGNVAIVSFLWRIDAGMKTERTVFTVDVWQRMNNSWQLSTRYADPVGDRRFVIPGAATIQPSFEKKY